MTDFDAARDWVDDNSVEEIANAIIEIGFACTDCGKCCRSDGPTDEHVATIFPEEIREIQNRIDGQWDDVARPIPYGLDDQGCGETFEWGLQTTSCGDCAFYRGQGSTGGCRIYSNRPFVCRTYPFQLAVPGLVTPGAGVVERAGSVLAFECEGLGRAIDIEHARELARQLKRRAHTEIEQSEGLLEQYSGRVPTAEAVVYDSEGAKARDGSELEGPS